MIQMNRKVVEQNPTTFPTQGFSASEMAQIRHVLYRFFATLFLYPNVARLGMIRDVAKGLREESATWDILPYGMALQQMLDLAVGLPAGEHITLEEDFVRLFTVNPVAVPYESVYVDKEGVTRTLIVSHIQSEYLAAGLEMAKGQIEPPDHVAVELEFMAYLVNQELEGLAEGMETETAVSRQRQADFLRRHLKRWYPDFATKVTQATPNVFYDQLVQTAFMFLHHELVLFNLNES